MADSSNQLEQERQLLARAIEDGGLTKWGTYARLSGPGWLQSAITLGGGSLAGSLYLGVLGGFTLLWVQPAFMVLGIIMLSAIGYITLSTGQRPFRAINNHVNPVLAWGWALACLMANIVWCLPQFSLANSVLEQNLAPGLFADDALGVTGGKLAVSLAIAVITVAITWSYGSGHWGIKLYEILLKCMVATIVVCFFVVVWSLNREGQIDWAGLFSGFIPNPATVFTPAPALQQKLDLIANPEMRDFWTAEIVQSQRDKVIAAAATAVGINMTFLFPYTLLRKGWTKEYRGLQTFDLATGMFIPFVLATSCVVIASASQFHAQPVPGLVADADGTAGEAGEGTATDGEKNDFVGRMRKRLLLENPAADELEGGGLDAAIAALPAEEQLIGAMLVDRDANRLARALEPATGDAAKWLFGIGVLGMTLSTITLLMLISGFVLCEIFDLPQSGWPFRLCCLPGALGALGPFVWSKAQFALAVPTSIFGFMLLPLAYLTFFILMNQRRLLGSEMPTGGRRVTWNILMGIAAGVAAYASVNEVVSRQPTWGPVALGVLLVLVAIGQIYRWQNPVRSE